MARRRANNAPQVPFSFKLVLNQWLLSLFNVGCFEDLAKHLRSEALEGLDENNVHHFYHALTSQLFNFTELSDQVLLGYDENIVKHTLRLNEQRITSGQPPVVWKYFQYLTLLFAEIYLDRYFHDPVVLRAALNSQIDKYNLGKPAADQVGPLDEAVEAWTQLNKLSFWMATGCGKTLLMHANILQYQHYLERHGRGGELNRVLLLTPNEGLSQQHLREFAAAGLYAEKFNKNAPTRAASLFQGKAIEIIEITRLRETAGEKTVAIEAFEANNLVLVDEGHRGTSAGDEGAWMKARNALCENGFSFEYSATFGQAVKGKPALVDLYAKSVLVDYSYRYFYGDGFGKDYQILNLDEDTQNAHLDLYMTACLLSFFQQQRLFRLQRAEFQRFQIEKPLWIFVGGSVTATLANQDASDIVEILKFLARYVADRPGSIERIGRVLNQGLPTATRQNLFEPPLHPSQHIGTHGGAGVRGVARRSLQRAWRRSAVRREPEGSRRRGRLALGGGERRVRGHQRRRRRQARSEVQRGWTGNRRERIQRIALPKARRSRLDHQPADRLQEVHGGLEQLAG